MSLYVFAKQYMVIAVKEPKAGKENLPRLTAHGTQ